MKTDEHRAVACTSLVSRYERWQKPYEKTERGKRTKKKYMEKQYWPESCQQCGLDAVYETIIFTGQRCRKALNGKLFGNRSKRIFVCDACG